MMSALSDVFERSSQERDSSEQHRASKSFESARGSSSSEHGYELQEVRIVEPPQEIQDVLEPRNSAEAEATRRSLFREYRERVERLNNPQGRGPAASSSRARSAFANAASPIAQTPRDSKELRRSTQMRPSMEQSMTSAQSIPQGEDLGAFVVQQTLEKAAQDNAKRKSFTAPRLGASFDKRASSIPQRVRVTLDQAPQNDGSAIQSVGATLVRRRVRLPWKLLLAFGIVSCLCLIVACTTLSIGIYNFTKLRAARAARSVDQLRDEIIPKVDAIARAVGAQLRRRYLK